jgi:hypothetical protein
LLHGHAPHGETSRWAAFELFRIEQRTTTQRRLQPLVVCR